MFTLSQPHQFDYCLQAQDYRIQYDSIVRIFLLPKVNMPQTLVVISLDPPIRWVQGMCGVGACEMGACGRVGGPSGWSVAEHAAQTQAYPSKP